MDHACVCYDDPHHDDYTQYTVNH